MGRLPIEHVGSEAASIATRWDRAIAKIGFCRLVASAVFSPLMVGVLDFGVLRITCPMDWFLDNGDACSIFVSCSAPAFAPIHFCF